MPDFLGVAAATPDPVAVIVIRLIVATVFGAAVAFVYRRTRRMPASSFTITLVLLAILIAMVTQVIGNNVARAFSLVGALSIVRFRTVVRDTEDTAFVIFAVTVGMAVGAQNLTVALVGLGVIGVTVFVMKPRRAAASHAVDEAQYLVTLRVGLGHDVETIVAPALDSHMVRRQFVSIGTVKQGMSVEVAYSGLMGPDKTPESLIKVLNRLDGIQSVDLVRQAPAAQDVWG